ncbi:GNAT family N-acetyltransferase [Nocardioides campestrisoli]|uniref:GNAT family N-acetyltransferase n=1 Tax=Nocardioides campestrisoli TaxID=2736757 RepID=UPI0015E68175|nr:hypothetical protein [Nocardioides campestrisoli]
MRDLLTTPMETIEADLAAFHAAVSKSPVFTTSDEPDATVYWSHLPLAACNVIATARIASADVPTRVPELLEPFRQRGLPFQWVTTPETTTPALEATLAQAGLTPHQAPAMHVNLEHPIDPLSPEHVYIDVAWPDHTEPAAATIFAGLGLSASASASHLGFLDTLDPADHQFFVARSMFTGEPQGAGSSHRRDGSVMFGNVTTLAQARGRGIEHALTGTMMNRARETGAGTATVIGTDSTYQALVALGFRTGFELVTWGWTPED